MQKIVNKSTAYAHCLENYSVGISFLNHFKIKRSISLVFLSIYPVSHIGSTPFSLPISEEKSYFINLTDLFPSESHGFHIEFNSDENIGVPFPAILITHFKNQTFNILHTYCRVDNDTNIDPSFSSSMLAEGSIDFFRHPKYRDFVDFIVGPSSYTSDIFLSGDGVTSKVNLSRELAPFSSHRIYIDEVLPTSLSNSYTDCVLNFQPQIGFFSRFFCGRISSSGSIMANHSYYARPDNISIYETITKYYPFNDGIDLEIIFPSSSHNSLYNVSVSLFNDGSLASEIYHYSCDSDSSLTISTSLLRSNATKNSILSLTFSAAEGSFLPQRIAHQLAFSNNIFSATNYLKPRYCVQESVTMPGSFFNLGKYYAWFALHFESNYSTKCCLCNSYITKPTNLTIKVYSPDGLLSNFTILLESLTSICIDMQYLQSIINPSYLKGFIWFFIQSDQPGIYGYCIHESNFSDHLTCEHTF